MSGSDWNGIDWLRMLATSFCLTELTSRQTNMAKKKAAKPKSSKTALSPRRSSEQLAIPTGYGELLDEIKGRIRSAQTKAVLAVNSELIVLYWSIGRDIVQRQRREGWGAKVIDRLAADLRSEFPEMSGLSRTNVYRMRAFYLAYESDGEIVPQPAGQLAEKGESTESQLARRAAALIVPQPVGQLPGEPSESVLGLPWGHNVVLLEKLDDSTKRRWYAQQTTANGWSRSMLLHWIDSNLFARQGKAVTNFQRTLPAPQSDLAQQLLKDPYNFDFLTLATDAHEREAEAGLMAHIRQFLLELGVGFAFVGQQYPLEVGGEEFSIDLLFYHCRLHCYFVIDLKMRSFEPEHAGKMSFYLSAVDELLRDPAVDQPTLGLILCRDKNRLIAEYALRDIHKPIGVAGWETKLVESLPKNLRGSLPTIEELEAELSREPAPVQPPKRRRRTDA